MDNKIFKRIVAAAAGVAMLGTCAFATSLTTASYSDGTLSFDYTVADGATKVTYLAYAATVAGESDETFTTVDGTKYVLGNIVAVNQLDEIPETTTESVAISADLLGEATNIVLMSGDDLGSDVALAAVATASTYTVSFEIAAELGLTAPTAIETTTGKATLPEAPAKEGYTFDGWYLEATPETLVAAGTEVDVAGDVKYFAKYTEVPAGPTVTFVNGETSTTLAVDKLSTLTKPANITLASLTLTDAQKYVDPTAGELVEAEYALSELSFLGWTDKAETVYLHDLTTEVPAYEASNPSGATYKAIADLANITESITLYAKYDTGYVTGDVNKDAKVNAMDRLAVINKLKNPPTITNGTKTDVRIFPLVMNGTKFAVTGDVNKDGKVNAMDRLAIINKLKNPPTITNGTETGVHIYFINE